MTLRPLVFALIAAVFSLFLAADPLHDTTEAATPSGAPTTIWGDLDCGGALAASDALVVIADTADAPTHQEEFCPLVGSPVSPSGGSDVPWGDLDCNGQADLLDVLLLLTAISGGDVNTGSCPAIESVTEIQSMADHYEIGDDWDDYGDAPNGGPTGYSSGAATGAFPTAEADGGPYHPLPFVAWLGEFETPEEEPLALDSADDGLVYLDLHECETSSALVAINTAGVPADARDEPLYLNAFMDWNRDGTWAGADSCAPEASVVNMEIDISGALDLDVVAVEFTGGAQIAEFWTRLMITTVPFSGSAIDEIDGETEDYLVVGAEATAGPLAAPAGVAEPQGGAKAGNQFGCKGGVVPHGAGQTLTLDIEQTTDSKNAGFTIKQFKASIPQPTDEKGKKVPGNPVGGTEIKMSTLTDGRVRIRLTVTMNSTEDEPERRVGPLLLQVSIEGKQQNDKKFDGHIDCAFIIDHTGTAATQNPDEDGFMGGPGRSGSPGTNSPKFIFAPHDKTITIESDALQTDDQKRGTKYDQNSVQVFGPDGNLIPAANLKNAAGIKEIKLPKTGRGLQIIPVKDTREEPLQIIMIKVKGLLADGTTEIWDYYRIVFVHEKGAKAKKLVDDFTNKTIASNYQYLQENQSDFLGYVTNDDTQLVYHTPPQYGLTFGPETLCTSNATDNIHNVGYGAPGTSFSMDHTENVNSDIYYLPEVPDEHGEGVHCSDIATNLTGFGPGSPYYLTNGGRCGTGFIFTEYNTIADTFRQGLVHENGAASGLGPIPGGSNIAEATCYERMDGSYRLAGTMMQGNGTSDGVILECPSCPGDDDEPSTQSAPEPIVIIDATEPNTHVRLLQVSPDTTKVLWQIQETEADGTTFVDAQIWVADFDADTLAVTNSEELTSMGANFSPAWSPGSDQIAFVSNRDAGNFEVYIMDVDGSDQENVTNTPDVTERGVSWQTP